MKNKIIIASLIVSVVILGILWADSRGFFDPKEEVVKTDTVFSIKTDTLWRDTTIVKEKPVEKKVEVVKVDTVYTTGGDTLTLLTEKKTYSERFINHKDTADVAVYTTGINTEVDSVSVKLKTHTEIVTNTVEITKYIQKKRKFLDRFHLGIQAGYGYTFNSKELQPYVGLGVGFEL